MNPNERDINLTEDNSRVESSTEILKASTSTDSEAMMPTPVIYLWEGILLVPLVGIIDSARAKNIEKKILEKIQEKGSKIVIIDVRALPHLDTSITSHINKITKIAGFMGCEVMLSGVDPRLAEQFMRLGIKETNFKSFLFLLDALEYSLEKFNLKMMKKEK